MHYEWGLIVFFICSFSICLIMLFFGFFLGEKSQLRIENSPFESGIDAVGSAKLNFSIKFYLIAVMFVIFDVESLYLYAWSVVVREVGWIGFIEAISFVFILLLGLFYAFCFDMFDWVKYPSDFFRHKNKKLIN